MNGALRITTIVPLAGLIPLGWVFLASFARLVPVPVRSFGEGFTRGPGTSR
ncbi:MAG TPA: hypothetical protein VK646_14260 [Actinomycetota bacterium]|nr:hypothetical protein [Actinomycetota bacterium]